MILNPQLVGKVLRGQKRQLRRPAHQDDRDNYLCPFHKSGVYSLQSKGGKEGVCRVRVESIELIWLPDMTEQEARLEGFENPEEFFAWWQEQFELPVDVRAWLLRIVRVREEKPRLLHRDSSHGYTSNPELALPGAGEAPPLDWQKQRTAKAHETDELRRQDSLEERLHRARVEAEASGVDASRLLASIDRRVQALERKLEQRAA